MPTWRSDDHGAEIPTLEQRAQQAAYGEAAEVSASLDECACRALRRGPDGWPATVDRVQHDYWECTPEQ